TQTEMGRDLARKAPLFQILDGRRRRPQLTQIMRLRGVQHLRMARLFRLAAYVFGLLARTAGFFWNRHSHRAGEGTHGFGETGARVLHQKGDGTAVGAATKAVVKLLCGTDSE